MIPVSLKRGDREASLEMYIPFMYGPIAPFGHKAFPPQPANLIFPKKLIGISGWVPRQRGISTRFIFRRIGEDGVILELAHSVTWDVISLTCPIAHCD